MPEKSVFVATALSGVIASGAIFLIISETGLRELIIKAIPTNLKLAIR